MELAETRTAVLADVVLDLDDLRSLLKLVKELTEWQGAEHWITSIRVTAPSGARFETSEYAVLDPGGRIEESGVHSFAVVARITEGFTGEISVNLTQGRASRADNYTVSGTDSNWVAGALRRLEEFFSQVEKQRSLTIIQRRSIVLGISLGLLVLAFVVAALGFRYAHETDYVVPGDKSTAYRNVSPIKATGFTIATVVLVAVAWPLSTAVRDWVDDLWPSIEFRVGRHYVSVEERRRKSVGVVLSLIVVPFVVAVAASLFLTVLP